MLPSRNRIKAWVPATETVVGLVAATLLILYTLHLSATSGRLAMSPFWDDISYMTVGLFRYQQLVEGHVGQFVMGLFQDHAPFQTVQATIAFLIFGPHEWAPYAVAGAQLFLVVLAVRPVMRDLPTVTAVALMLLVLASPVSVNIVGEFRPDLFWGFLCGWSCFLILQRSSLQAPCRNQVRVILSAAAAIYWKPSAVMVTGAIIALASVLALVQTWFEQEHAAGGFRSALRRYALSAIALFVLLLPYFVPNAALLVAYSQWLFEPTFTYHGSMLEHANFYLFGETYGHNPSFLLWVGLIVLVVHAIVRSATILGSAGRYWLFAAVLCFAYLIAAFSPVKSYYLGGAFYGCFLWFTLVGLADLLLYAQAAFPRMSFVGAPAILGVLCLLTFQLNPLWCTVAPADALSAGATVHGIADPCTVLPADAAAIRAISDGVADAILADMQRRNVVYATVFFQTTDPVESTYVVWRAALAHKLIVPVDSFFRSSLKEDERVMSGADYAFLSEAAIPSHIDYPGYRFNSDMFTWAKTNSSFSAIWNFVDAQQKESYLFRRTAAL